MGAVVPLSGVPVDVPDDYAPIATLLGIPADTRLVEGIIKVSGGSVDFALSGSAPETTTDGQTYVDTSGQAWGPVQNVKYAIRLGDLYVRETSAGAGAKVSVLGVGEVVA